MTNSEGDTVIYLIGTSGHPNYGDELVTASWLRHLARTQPAAQVWVDCPRPGQSAVLHGGLHPRARFVDTLYHAAWNAPSDSADDSLAFGRQVVGSPGLIAREASGVESLEQVDVVHIMGGSYINQNWPRHLVLVAAAAEMAERYGARTAMTGASLLPLAEGSKDDLSSILASFDVVDVRDEASRHVMAPAVPHLSCSGDDAFLDPQLTEQDRDFPAKTLISVQSDFLTVPLEQIADYVVRTLKEWQSDQEKVFVVECLPPNDVAIAPLLAPHVPQLEVLPFSIMWRYGFPASPRSRWITTRFHPHLVGAANGAWGVVLPVGGDYSMVEASTLTDAGSGWQVAPDLDTIVPWSRYVTSPFGGALARLRDAKSAVASAVGELSRP